MKKQYAVIGNPVLHSLSPLIHQRAFDFYQIEARYFAYEVEDFSAFMQYFHAETKRGIRFRTLGTFHGRMMFRCFRRADLFPIPILAAKAVYIKKI